MEKEDLNAMKKAGKPLRTGDVAKILEKDSKEIDKVMDALKKKGKNASPKRCYWEPA